MPAFSPQQDAALKACRGLAEGQAGQRRHAAALPPVRLCRHRQDHARQAHRRGRRRQGPVRGLHRQGRAGDAQQGLRRRLHHPQPDLPGARERRGDAELRAVGRRAGLEGQAHRHRRMLDGRRRARPRPDVVRRAAAGARRSGATAADPGRRLLHRRRARRHADRGAPAGAERSDRAAVDGRPRRPAARAGRLRRDAGGAARRRSTRSACSRPTRCWSAATPRGAPTTRACASAAASPSALPMAGDKLVCLRNNRRKGLFNGGALDGEGAPATAPATSSRMRSAARRGRRRPHRQGLGAAGMLHRRRSSSSSGRSASATTNSTSATCSPCTRRRARNGTTSCCSTSSFAFPDSRDRWLYTGVTRAAKRLTVVV